MGTWNNKPFGNDTALDWVISLEKAAVPRDFIYDTLLAIDGDWDGDVSDAEEAIAAVAIISAASLNPIASVGAEAKKWIATTGFVPDKHLIVTSISVLSRICSDSELRNLWSEAGGLPSWLRVIKTLLTNLESAAMAETLIRTPQARAAPRLLCKMAAHFAAEPSDLLQEKIRKKIERLTDVDSATNETGNISPLALVSKFGLLSEAKVLLDKGANPDGLPDEAPPFCLACSGGHVAIAELLCGAGARVFYEVTRDPERITLDQYRKQGIEPKKIGYRYCLALFLVASEGNSAGADYLLTLGADIYQTDLNGENLLHKACRSGNLGMVKYLLMSGLHVDSRKGSNAESALHSAVAGGNVSVVEFLLDQGANPNVIDKYEGQTHNWHIAPLDLVQDKKSALYSLLRARGALFAAELMDTFPPHGPA
ncbi:MAG: ankyrin repeat domain-containing protein [Pseudomonadota bacterium]